MESQPEEVPAQLNLDLKDGIPTDPISSVCPECGEQGETKFMFTRIPFFKEIIVSAFNCEHCGHRNTETQFAGKLEDYGVRYEVKVINTVAFNRKVVKSDFCTISVPEAGLEIPPETQKGSIKTIEGYFLSTIDALKQGQEVRKYMDPENHAKIEEYCDKLMGFATGKSMPFTFIVEDPSGNSFVENPSAPTSDQYCKKTHWLRSRDEYTLMGYPIDQESYQAEIDRINAEKNLDSAQITAAKKNFITGDKKAMVQTKEEQEALFTKLSSYQQKFEGSQAKQAAVDAGYVDFSKPIDDQGDKDELADDDPRKMVMKFETPCSNCQKMGNVQMCFSSIPFFKEIIMMAFVCDHCGYRNSEIKEGGGVGNQAKKITFKVNCVADLNRDVFKSGTAKFTIPEVGLDMDSGTLGSLYTTVEGLVSKVIEEMKENNPFGRGDSAEDKKFLEFIDKLEDCKEARMPWTLILDDAADNCFIYNPLAPFDDPQIVIDMYDRTEEQNDDLGILHMNVDQQEDADMNADTDAGKEEAKE